MLGVPLENVHVIWMTGPGLLRPQRRRRLRGGLPRCWPRRSASRCACNTCATRAPAGTRRARPRSTARAPRSTPRATSSPTSSSARASRGSTSTPTAASRSTRSPGQTLGVALKSGDGFGVPAESYEFANKRTSWETIPPLLDRSSPLRTSHLRDPVGPQIHFASEVVHGRGGGGDQPGPDRVPAEAHQGRPRHRGDQGARRRSSAGTRGRRRARARPATR